MAESLYPYQEEGARWLSTKRFALLADEMRLGKTPQAIRAADLVMARSILVVCPAVARMNWAREFERFSTRPRDVTVLLSSRISKPVSPVCVTSYDILSAASPIGSKWDLVILDECHYLKNRKAVRTKAVFGKKGAAFGANRVWALSGTPAPNNAAELWPLLRAFGVTDLDYFAFVKTFCSGYDGPYGFTITGTRNVDRLKAMLAPIMLRRKKDDVLKDLPPIQSSVITVLPTELDIGEMEMAFQRYIVSGWDEFKKDIAKEEGKLMPAFNADPEKALRELSAPCATLRRYTGVLKIGAVIDLLKEELAGNQRKLVIFCVHRAVIEGLRVGLQEFGPVTLYGGTADDKRQRNLKKFMTEDKTRVFIGNIKAAGTAIDLSVADDVLVVESEWTPGDIAQAIERVRHPTKTRPVSVRFVALAGSIDEKIQQILERKTRAVSEIFN